MLYCHSYNHAQEHGELEQWEESWHENIRCKRYVDELLAGCSHLEIPEQAVVELYRNFEKENIEYVLAKTIYERSANKHFDDADTQWASRYQFYPEDNLLHMCLLMVLSAPGYDISRLLKCVLERPCECDRAG